MTLNNSGWIKLGIFEWITIMGTLIGCFTFLFTLIHRMETRSEEKYIKAIERGDRLYELYVETQREIKDIYKNKDR